MMMPSVTREGRDNAEIAALRKKIAEYNDLETKAYLEAQLRELEKKHGKKPEGPPEDPSTARLEAMGYKVTDLSKL